VSLTLNSDLLEKIKESGAETVALQFPEGLKRKAFLFSEQLKKEGYRVLISGNPCWGACDLDLEILGRADILIHFGHAPVGDFERVIYEPYFQEIDTGSLEKVLPHLSSGKLSVVTTVQHAPQTDEIIEFFRSNGYSCTTGKTSERTPYRGQVLGCTYSAAKNTGADEILYIGTGVFHAIGVKLATGVKVTAFDPVTGIIQTIDESKMLRIRFAKIEKARSADKTAIIVSTKSGQIREELAERLHTLSDKADIVYLKEITPDALLNLGYDCYVNTACPRLAYDDNVRFPAPLLSPEEYEILLGVREWEDYEIDEIV